MSKPTPHTARVFSTNFLNNMLEHDEKSFVPFSDYMELLDKVKA